MDTQIYVKFKVDGGSKIGRIYLLAHYVFKRKWKLSRRNHMIMLQQLRMLCSSNCKLCFDKKSQSISPPGPIALTLLSLTCALPQPTAKWWNHSRTINHSNPKVPPSYPPGIPSSCLMESIFLYPLNYHYFSPPTSKTWTSTAMETKRPGTYDAKVEVRVAMRVHPIRR